jgi:hypothetical protein
LDVINNLLKGGVCAVAAASAFLAQPVQAAPSCWNAQRVAAAKVRDLQSRLMVATMRCSAMGINILPAYNEFVRTNRSTLQSANGLIKAQFTATYGSRGVTEYDSFTTRLANAYGADPTNAAICARTASLARQAVDANGDIGQLLQVVESMGRTPDLPGGECQISFAEAR